MRKYLLFIVTAFSFAVSFAQDFKFLLEVRPSFEPILQIKVNNSGAVASVYCNFKSSGDSSKILIEQEDISKLFEFLTSYSFPNRTSYNHEGVPVKHYENTVFVPEQNIVIIGPDTLFDDFSALIIDGDTLEASPGAFGKDLKFDSIKMQYYRNMVSRQVYTDGTTYVGQFESDQATRDFEIYYRRFSESDLKLISMLLDLIGDRESPYYHYLALHLKEITIENCASN